MAIRVLRPKIAGSFWLWGNDPKRQATPQPRVALEVDEALIGGSPSSVLNDTVSGGSPPSRLTDVVSGGTP